MFGYFTAKKQELNINYFFRYICLSSVTNNYFVKLTFTRINKYIDFDFGLIFRRGQGLLILVCLHFLSNLREKRKF